MVALMAGLHPAFTFAVDHLSSDQALRLPCACRIRTFRCWTLISLAGRDAWLHLIGLCRQPWCTEGGEPPFAGWVVQEAAESI
jgi:hypothetical protein